MAAKRRHWKETGGRFWARIAVPVSLRQHFQKKTQLTVFLGNDRRVADRNHAAAVALLQDQISGARQSTAVTIVGPRHIITNPGVTASDLQQMALDLYNGLTEDDEQKRARMPTPAEMEIERERILQRIDAGELNSAKQPSFLINANTDYELMLIARSSDANLRKRRLAALQVSLVSGDTRLVDAVILSNIAKRGLVVERNSPAWYEIGRALMRAEIEALSRSFERENGDYGGNPSDPILTPSTGLVSEALPVSIRTIFFDYIVNRQAVGKHNDGAKRWEASVTHLIEFIGHSDARKLSKRNLLDWRDKLLA